MGQILRSLLGYCKMSFILQIGRLKPLGHMQAAT